MNSQCSTKPAFNTPQQIGDKVGSGSFGTVSSIDLKQSKRKPDANGTFYIQVLDENTSKGITDRYFHEVENKGAKKQKTKNEKHTDIGLLVHTKEPIAFVQKLPSRNGKEIQISENVVEILAKYADNLAQFIVYTPSAQNQHMQIMQKLKTVHSVFRELNENKQSPLEFAEKYAKWGKTALAALGKYGIVHQDATPRNVVCAYTENGWEFRFIDLDSLRSLKDDINMAPCSQISIYAKGNIETWTEDQAILINLVSFAITSIVELSKSKLLFPQYISEFFEIFNRILPNFNETKVKATATALKSGTDNSPSSLDHKFALEIAQKINDCQNVEPLDQLMYNAGLLNLNPRQAGDDTAQLTPTPKQAGDKAEQLTFTPKQAGDDSLAANAP